MATDDKEFKKAWQLDKIVIMIVGEAGKPKEPCYLGTIEHELGIDNLKLRRYIEEEEHLFKIIDEHPTFGSRKEGTVILTEQGKTIYKKEGAWFVKRLKLQRSINEIDKEQEERKEKIVDLQQILKERKERKEKILLWTFNGIGWIVAIIVAIWAAWGNDNSKLYDQKEDRWEKEKIQLQSQVDALTKQINSIPDSIKGKYPVGN